MKSRARAALVVLSASLLNGCGGSTPPLEPAPPGPPAADLGQLPAPAAPKLSRQAFNQGAVRLNLPLFWAADSDGDGEPDPNEIHTLSFYPTSPAWTSGGRFSAELEQARAAIEAPRAKESG
jgi:hypothetical protein